MTTAELPYELIEAKLAPPALRLDTVAKTELIDRLCASKARAVSVVAPGRLRQDDAARAPGRAR